MDNIQRKIALGTIFRGTTGSAEDAGLPEARWTWEIAFHHHRVQGPGKNVAAALQKAHAEGRGAHRVKGGKTNGRGANRRSARCAGSRARDPLPVTADSYSRNLRFKDVENALQAGKDINGMSSGRKPRSQRLDATVLWKLLGRPVTIKHGSIDARLVAEIGFASGMSDINGNIYSWGLTYNKNVSLLSILKVQQYIDRLAGYYAENGIIIAREQGGGQGPGCFGCRVSRSPTLSSGH